jgi:hypothetical protein
MSLAYGYELQENDDILVPVQKTSEIMSQVVLPGAALVNHLPFCTGPTFHYQLRFLSGLFSAIHPFVDSLV